MHPLIRSAVTCALTLAAACAGAQTAYPGTKPIRLVVPFAAGSAPDVLARLLAQSLADSMTATVNVENVPGAGGTIGVDRVAKAAPDGYTLLLSGDAALVLHGSYGVNPPYQTLRDLTPIAQLAVTANVLVVGNDVPARTVQELVALVRSQPGRFSYATGGIGLSQHRAGELLNRMAGLDLVHVPSSTSPLPDVVSGRVQLSFANVVAALPLVRDGKLRALAVTSLARSAVAPELPTMSESGFPGFESVAWFGLLAPAGTPPAVVQRLETEVQKALAGPTLSARLATMGATTPVAGAAAFTRVIQEETVKWSAKEPTTAAQRP
jgi:tripartite-type tricarboxylate transporter receptor subunit TctC